MGHEGGVLFVSDLGGSSAVFLDMLGSIWFLRSQNVPKTSPNNYWCKCLNIYRYNCSMTRLELTLFGSFTASIANEPVTQFRTDKVRALLAYLAMNAERPFRRDILATLLWPEWADKAARRNLRQTAHRLRQMLDGICPTLGTDILTTTRQTMQLNRSAVIVDVIQFQKTVAGV